MMKRKPNGYWTYQRCKEEALKYDKRNKFQKKDPAHIISYLKINGMSYYNIW